MLLAGLSHSHKRIKGSALALLTACLLVSTSTFDTACQELLPLVIELGSVASTTMSSDMDTVIDILGSRLPADTFSYALLPSFEASSLMHLPARSVHHLAPAWTVRSESSRMRVLHAARAHCSRARLW